MRPWALLAAAISLSITGSQADPGRARIADALENGAVCAARDHDGRRFRDSYLTYVYPDEHLPAIVVTDGHDRETPTYRMLDADLILSMIAATGARPAPLAVATAAARQRLAAVVAVWRGLGLDNVRKGARVDGVALDTYCMVGDLARDEKMAKVVTSAIDGDGWLAAGLYDGDEAFRREADECWCLRFLSRTPDATGAVRTRIVEVFRSSAKEPGSTASFYRAFHLGLALEQNRSPDLPLLEEITLALTRWGAVNDDDAILEWANLGTATFLGGEAGSLLRRRAIRVLLERQGGDGCWQVPGMSPENYGATFLTLRALAALATELARDSAPNPAP